MDHLEAGPDAKADAHVLAVSPRRDWPWLAHYSPGVPHAVVIPEQPLTWILDEALRRHGASTAVTYYGTQLSYVQLGSLVDRLARALIRLGVRRGDRVAVCLPNVPQFPIAFYAVLKAGGVVVPTNPLYTAPELRHQLVDCGARILITLDMTLPVYAEVRDEVPVEHVVVTSPADYLPAGLSVLYHIRERGNRDRLPAGTQSLQADAAVHEFRDLLGRSHGRQGYEVFPLPEPASPDDLAVLQYTGGTTGVSKGAMLTHRNLLSNALQALAWNDLPPDYKHVSLCVAPFFHVYGLTVGMNLTMLDGAMMVLLPRFTVKDTLHAIEKYRPDLFPGVPTMYLALAREAERKHHDLSSVKVCISGSAPLPAEVQRRFEAISGAKVVEGYGLTEASPVTHCNPVFGERRIGTIGLPLPGTEAAIVNWDTMEFLPPGQQGEICVRGPQVMAGYWQRPDETAEVLRDGWLRTGDIGVCSEDGYFSVVDRAKDIIIAGGLKIFPRDVDEVLYQHPKVLEAAAVGVPDEYRGETVRAYVVVKPGERLTEAELDAFMKERLAPYKVPKQYEFRDDLPKTLVGKVLRRALRDEYIAQHGSSGAAQLTSGADSKTSNIPS